MSTIDIEHLRQWVGRSWLRQDALTAFPARALAAALDREQLPEAGDTLPPSWQWLYFHEPVRQQLMGRDGHPATGGQLPPVPLPRRMWASGSFEVLRPLRLDSPAQVRSEILSVEHKQGGSGSLVFVTLEHRFEQHGELCLSERQHLVYRAMPDGPAPLPPGERSAHAAEVREPFVVDPLLLFRYSALTYNGHRIHYDREYATGTEFYPALVVHGPLLATRLAEQVARLAPGRTIREFSFRAVRPAFDSDKLSVCARHTEQGLELWTENQNGFVTMRATARLEAL